VPGSVPGSVPGCMPGLYGRLCLCGPVGISGPGEWVRTEDLDAVKGLLPHSLELSQRLLHLTVELYSTHNGTKEKL